MTILGRIMALFPLLHATLIFGCITFFVWSPTWLSVLSLPLAVYVFPIIVFRLHNLFFPLLDGIYDLASSRYSPWWGSYQIQLVFNAFTGLERALLIVPGLYALWLRAWGSKVGKRVFFAANTEVLDRSLLILGDDIVVGAHVIFCAHGITPKAGKQLLIIKTIKVGARSFIGAESRLGPGASVKADALLGYRSITSTLKPKL